MKFIDSEIRGLRRTPREALVIAAGVGLFCYELTRPGSNLWYLAFYAVATFLFATRFYAARVVGVAMLFTSLGVSLLPLRPGAAYAYGHAPWQWYALVALGLLVLASRDLRERFDRGPSGTGWRANYWRDLPRSHWTVCCLSGYLLGLFGNLVFMSWQAAGAWQTLWWPGVMCGAIWACVILMLLGRNLAFLAASAIATFGLVQIVPHVTAAEAFRAQGWRVAAPDSPLWSATPDFALPAAITAAAVLALAAPYAAYHVWKSLTTHGA